MEQVLEELLEEVLEQVPDPEQVLEEVPEPLPEQPCRYMTAYSARRSRCRPFVMFADQTTVRLLQTCYHAIISDTLRFCHSDKLTTWCHVGVVRVECCHTDVCRHVVAHDCHCHCRRGVCQANATRCENGIMLDSSSVTRHLLRS